MENRKEFYDRDEKKYNVKKWGMNVKYGKHYSNGKPYTKPYVIKKVKTHRYMSDTEYKMLWTVVWLLFIFGLCFVFKSALPLWLLFIWFLGII